MNPADSPLCWLALARPKRDHTDAECEDAWAADPAAGRFAVADGASESAFAGLWARLLAEEFVVRPPSPDPWGWLDGPRRSWSAEVMALELPWYAEMKRDEGAFATLLGLDVRLPAAGRPGLWRAAAVGDSCLVRLRKGRHVRAFPMKRSADFGNTPKLIGSWDRAAPAGACTSGSLLPGDCLYLMTDALAQWFLHAQEAGGRPWEAIEPLRSADSPDDAFASWVEEQRDTGGLRDDDVTLLVIEIGSVPEE